MGDYIPKYAPGTDVTAVAGGTITGGQVVEVTAAATASTPVTVAVTSGASAAVKGVATRDVVTGELVAISRGGIQRCVSGAAVAVNAPLKSAATGRVVTYVVGTDPVTQLIGYAESAAGAAGTAIDVRWVI